MKSFVLIAFILCFDHSNSKDEQINVLGTRLESCSTSPMTGYYRSGSCEWHGSGDYGVHTVCARMTREFLEFTRSRGNDLSSPSRTSNFPGLKEGDRWCLCARRWKEAMDARKAPPVILRSTHRVTLQDVSLDDLRQHAFGNNNRRRVQTRT